MSESPGGRRSWKGDFFMLTNADLAVLNEAYRSRRKGVETINTVISKV